MIILIFLAVLVAFIWLIFKASEKRVLAIDTEMVGAGDRGSISMLAKVSIVDRTGHVIYDEYVAPTLPVTAYRTPWSGIQERDLIHAKSFYQVRQEVLNLLKGCILVGHDLQFDLKALNIAHPAKDIRDTALYMPFRDSRYNKTQKPSLKELAFEFLGKSIQIGQHSSVEDARAAMDLYSTVEYNWESRYR